jgi:ubiquitin C-terminal hydrolase
LQCINATRKLSIYFRSDDWVNDINRNNVLGAGGELATAYATLVRALWSGQASSVSPTEIKKVVERHAPQFLGWGQHDAHEFLSFFLDLLLEDICRVQKKPYIADTDTSNLTDVEIAKQSWDNYILRNDSAIADMFAGQFRSNVECNECGHKSITFDPFTSISVPIRESVEDFDIYLLPETPGAEDINKVTKFTFFYPSSREPIAAQVSQWLLNSIADTSHAKMINTNMNEISPSYVKVDTDMSAGSKCPWEVVFFIQTLKDRKEDADDTFLPLDYIPHSAHFVRYINDVTRVNKRTKGEFVIFAQIVRGSTPYSDDIKSKIKSIDGNYTLGIHSLGDGPKECVDFAWIFQQTKDSQEKLSFAMDAMVLSLREHKGVILGKNSIITRKQLVDNIDKMFCKRYTGEDRLYTIHSIPYDIKNLYSSLKANILNTGELFMVTDDNSMVDLSAPFALSVVFQNASSLVRVSCKAAPGISDKASVQMPPIMLDHCFKAFGMTEQLGEEDKWYCSKCKNHVRAYKTMSLWRTPDILVVHLKRFQQIRQSYYLRTKKINLPIQYPLSGMDVSTLLHPSYEKKNGTIYDLYAISQHFGSMNGGHYTAVAYNPELKKWISFDDSSTTVCNPPSNSDESAYLLFYQKRNNDTSINEVTNGNNIVPEIDNGYASMEE